jgi:hypothetical protein
MTDDQFRDLMKSLRIITYLLAIIAAGMFGIDYTAKF